MHDRKRGHGTDKQKKKWSFGFKLFSRLYIYCFRAKYSTFSNLQDPTSLCMFIYLYSRWFFNYRYCIVFVTILVYEYDIKQDSGSGSDSMFKTILA